MGEAKTKTQYLPPSVIKAEAAKALRLYISRYGTSLPFNAERLLESEYNMSIIPLPGIKKIGIECSFCRDGLTIFVDEQDYDDESMVNRLCFTFAHELGHKILHSKYLSCIDALSDEQFEWLEKQARMFAADFLVPEPLLLGVIASEVIERFDSIASSNISLEACIGYRITNLADYFGVSTHAMRNRLKNVDYGQLLQGPYISQVDKDRFIELATTVEKVGDKSWTIRSLAAGLES